MAETEEQQSREDVNHSVAAAAPLPTRPAGPAVPPIQVSYPLLSAKFVAIHFELILVFRQSDEHYSQMLTQAPVDHIVEYAPLICLLA